MIDPKDISKLRKKLNLTQSDLATESGVSQSLIAKIESNLLDPSYSNMKKIADAINRLEKKLERTAKDLVTKKIISVKPTTLIKNIIPLLKKHSISQILVIDKHIVGLITETEIIDAMLDKKEKEITAKDIMTSSPPIVEIDAPETIIFDLLKHYPIVIVKDKKELIGVITKSNLLELIRE
jgi:predicted transcriptional regulator